MFSEHYKTLTQQIKEDLSKWEDTHAHGSEHLMLLRQYSPNDLQSQ